MLKYKQPRKETKNIMEALMLRSMLTLGEVYNCDTYGAGDFGDGGKCATTQNNTGNGTNTGTVAVGKDGTLVNTGSPYFLPLAGGALLVVIAAALVIAMLVKRRKQSN